MMDGRASLANSFVHHIQAALPPTNTSFLVVTTKAALQTAIRGEASGTKRIYWSNS
jgi:hypothetical protein